MVDSEQEFVNHPTPQAVCSVERYARAARSCGVPRDQFEHLLRAGAVLQGRQLAASAAARLCDRPGGPTQVGYGGARGGGKSHWGLIQVAADDCQRCPGLKVLVLRKVGKALREGFRDMLRRTLAGLAWRYVDSDQTLYFPNGSRILLGHFQKESDIDAYLGLEYDVILVEEATTLSHSKYVAIRTCLRTSKSDWRPRMYSTTNPGNLGHQWYKRAFITPHRRALLLPGESYNAGFVPLQRQEGDTRFVPATVYDNAFVNKEYRAVLDSLTGWKRRAWRDGDWDIAAGQFFTNFRRETHVRAPFGELPTSWRKWGALDYGFTHYTTFYLLAEGDGKTNVVDEHGAQQWLPKRHVEAVRALLSRYDLEINDLDVIVAGNDIFQKRPNGETVADVYRGLGVSMTGANDDRVNGAAALLEGFGDVDAGISPWLYLTERCPNLAETIPMLEHDPTHPEKVQKWDVDEDGIGGDDWYDGARYGVMARTLPGGGGFAMRY